MATITSEKASIALRNYVSKAYPNVNTFLRNVYDGNTEEEINCLDSLMQSNSFLSGKSLYRGIDGNFFNLNLGDIYVDKAYSSTSIHLDDAFKFVKDGGMLLIFHNIHRIQSINVNEKLSNGNDEGEFILPRGYEFRVDSKDVYNDQHLFQNNSKYAPLLLDKYPDIKNLTVYQLSPILSVNKYYRPEWTCGRYNEKRHVAIMYNLLEGMAHYFEDISADFISVILNAQRNCEIEYDRLVSITHLPESTVDDFLKQLVGIGIVTESLPTSESIFQYRARICFSRQTEGKSATKNETYDESPIDQNTAEMSYADALRSDGVITSAMFELTYSCSEMCIHCYNIGATRNCNEKSGRSVFKELTLSDYKRIIDELYEQGLVKVCLTGGDPFSKQCIWEIIEYLFEKGVAFDVFTNGQKLLGSEHRLASYYPRLVGVSIYSAEREIHDGITRVKGSLEKSLQVMDRLCQLAVPLNLKCCIMRPNVKSYRSVLALADKYCAVPQLEVNVTDSISGDKCVSNFLRLNEKEMRVVLRDVNVPLYVSLGPECLVSHRKLTNKACGAGESSICITPDGEVIPCCALHYSFGSVKEKSMCEIIASDQRASWLGCILEKYDECLRHEYCNYCNLCPGVNFAENGTVKKAGENNCYLAKIRYQLLQDLQNGNDPLAGRSIDQAIEELPNPSIGSIHRIL